MVAWALGIQMLMLSVVMIKLQLTNLEAKFFMVIPLNK